MGFIGGRMRGTGTMGVKVQTFENEVSEAMKLLFQKLDEAIDDMEQGRAQTLDEAWKEIDCI